MSKAVHFGAGNIGRGFIGEILFENGFHIDFVDVNERIIDACFNNNSGDIVYAIDSLGIIYKIDLTSYDNIIVSKLIVNGINDIKFNSPKIFFK